MDDGNRAAHRRFVIQPRAAFPGRLLQFVPVQGERHLIGRDERLALLQRRQIPLERRLFAAQKFQNDQNFRVVQQIVHLVGQHALRQIDLPLLMHVPHQRPLYFETEPCTVGKFL